MYLTRQLLFYGMQLAVVFSGCHHTDDLANDLNTDNSASTDSNTAFSETESQDSQTTFDSGGAKDSDSFSEAPLDDTGDTEPQDDTGDTEPQKDETVYLNTEDCDVNTTAGWAVPDADRDGYGDANALWSEKLCLEGALPDGYVWLREHELSNEPLDCDDTNPDIRVPVCLDWDGDTVCAKSPYSQVKCRTAGDIPNGYTALRIHCEKRWKIDFCCQSSPGSIPVFEKKFTANRSGCDSIYCSSSYKMV